MITGELEPLQCPRLLEPVYPYNPRPDHPMQHQISCEIHDGMIVDLEPSHKIPERPL
mgnify:CR=1 FL=1